MPPPKSNKNTQQLWKIFKSQVLNSVLEYLQSLKFILDQVLILFTKKNLHLHTDCDGRNLKDKALWFCLLNGWVWGVRVCAGVQSHDRNSASESSGWAGPSWLCRCVNSLAWSQPQSPDGSNNRTVTAPTYRAFTMHQALAYIKSHLISLMWILFSFQCLKGGNSGCER